jgi:hypothetical protein
MGLDLDKLENDGFVLLKGVLPRRAIDAFEDEIARLTAAQLAKRGVTPSGEVEPLIELFRLGGKFRHVLYTAMQYLSALTEVKARIIELSAPGGLLEPLGFKVPIATSALRVDLPNEVHFTEPVHQDYSSYAPPAFHCWVSFRRADEHFGSVRVWPGTHKRGFVPHNVDNPRRPFVEPRHYEGLPSAVVETEPGDILFFNAFLFHASVPNRSNRIKFTGGFIMQDLARIEDPEDPTSPIWPMLEMTRKRESKNREAANA